MNCMRTSLFISLIFMCLLVSAQSKGTSQEPSKAAYAERAKKEKPKAMKMSNDKNNKKTKAEMQEPSEAAYAERAKKEKPKAMKVNNAKVVQQDKKVVVNEQPNEQPQQSKAGWQQSVAQKVRTQKNSQSVQQNEERKGNNEQLQQPKDYSYSIPQKDNSHNIPQSSQQNEIKGNKESLAPQNLNKLSDEQKKQLIEKIRGVKNKQRTEKANQVGPQNNEEKADQAKENDSPIVGKIIPIDEENRFNNSATENQDVDTSNDVRIGFDSQEGDVIAGVKDNKGITAENGILKQGEVVNAQDVSAKLEKARKETEYKEMFKSPGFKVGDKNVMEACDNWIKADEKAEIFSKYKEKIDGLSKKYKDENSLRQEAKKDPELSQYVQKIENYEEENGTNYSVKNTVDDRYSKAQADAKKKWDILIDKFENCKDCKTK